MKVRVSCGHIMNDQLWLYVHGLGRNMFRGMFRTLSNNKKRTKKYKFIPSLKTVKIF